jgi:predicted RND superfamily exporter protein
VALVCDATSFAVLMVIRIGAIQQLATVATIGVALLVITNLILIPITLSYIGVNPAAAERSQRTGVNYTSKRNPVWAFLDLFTQRKWAALAILCSVVVAGVGCYVGRNVQIGDLYPGAPELRQDSQYNKDNAFIVQHYAVGSDELVVLADTPRDTCLDYKTMNAMDRLQWQLDQMPQVASTSSAASFEAYMMAALTEGSPKWFGLVPNTGMLYQTKYVVPRALMNFACSFDPINISLNDHKAATLSAVVNAAQKFINDPADQAPNLKLSLLGGNAGIDAATNIVVAQANIIMLVLIYTVVTIFCFIAFKSWRAVLCAMIPLAITSILAQALMVWLHIGIKVATLPVSALGVGIGVDYALYVLSLLRDADVNRKGRSPHRVHPRGGRHHLDFRTHQIPGGYGAAACLHVPLEHARRNGSPASTRNLPPAGKIVCKAKVQRNSLNILDAGTAALIQGHK